MDDREAPPVCALVGYTVELPEVPEMDLQDLEDLDQHIAAEQHRIDGMKRTADGLRRRADAMDARREEAIKDLRAKRLLHRQGKLEMELFEMKTRMAQLEGELKATKEAQEGSADA